MLKLLRYVSFPQILHTYIRNMSLSKKNVVYKQGLFICIMLNNVCSMSNGAITLFGDTVYLSHPFKRFLYLELYLFLKFISYCNTFLQIGHYDSALNCKY